VGAADVLTAAAAVLVAAALVGALGRLGRSSQWSSSAARTGACRLAERLATAADDGALLALEADRIADPRLRAAFRDLADRVADTWRLATVDPLTGIASRQAVLARLDEGSRAPRSTAGRCR
jgi:hypothetical protein